VTYFFLSYARGDDDSYVERFFEDLSKEVRVLAGLSSGDEVGFFDQSSMKVGEEWPARLAAELGRCRSFVALYTPRFFLSEACGKEWAIFRDRVEAFEQDLTEPTSALIPLLWAPVTDLPAAVQSIQYTNNEMGTAYNEGGLRQLLRLRRHRDAYRQAIFRIATRIVTANRSTKTLPPRTPPPYQDAKSAFHHEGNTVREPLAGPQVVRFVVVSASREQAGRIRGDTSFYGESPEEWAPYRPGVNGSLCELARRMATLHSYVTSVDTIDGLPRCLRDAGRYNQIVVLLVDPWSLMMENVQEKLVEFDQLEEPTTAVLIPWSLEDEETRQNSDELRRAIRQTFPNSTQRRDDVMFRSSVLTAESFGADLPVVLEVARNRMFTRGTVYRRPPEPPGRPILEGPTGDDL
jgi:FxsC-like protein